MTDLSPFDPHSMWSSLREEYVEYALLGGLCSEFWRRQFPVDVLRAHTDQSGFDIVLEAGPLQRHVQIKSSFVGSSTRVQKVNLKLEEKVGGCVVWAFFDASTLAIQHFGWFGDKDPRKATPSLGMREAKHTKANADGVKSVRPGIRTLRKGDFKYLPSIWALASHLFPPDSPASEEEQIP